MTQDAEQVADKQLNAPPSFSVVVAGSRTRVVELLQTFRIEILT